MSVNRRVSASRWPKLPAMPDLSPVVRMRAAASEVGLPPDIAVELEALIAEWLGHLAEATAQEAMLRRIGAPGWLRARSQALRLQARAIVAELRDLQATSRRDRAEPLLASPDLSPLAGFDRSPLVRLRALAAADGLSPANTAALLSLTVEWQDIADRCAREEARARRISSPGWLRLQAMRIQARAIVAELHDLADTTEPRSRASTRPGGPG